MNPKQEGCVSFQMEKANRFLVKVLANISLCSNNASSGTSFIETRTHTVGLPPWDSAKVVPYDPVMTSS